MNKSNRKSRSLTLNAQTIRTLTPTALGDVAGGAPLTLRCLTGSWVCPKLPDDQRD